MSWPDFKHITVKFLLNCAVFIWKTLARFGKINVIKDKVIYPRFFANFEPKLSDFGQKNFGYHCLDRLIETYKTFGDFECFINGHFDLEGHTSSCGSKRKTISQFIEDAKSIGKKLFHLGLRKGDTVHLLLPNFTDYHAIAIGIWMCEATLSLGDPNSNTEVISTQIRDTNARWIFCFEESRHNTFNALKDLDLLGEVKVIVVEKSCPNENEDLHITEKGFMFYNDFMECSNDFMECSNDFIDPPLLQDGPLLDDEVFLILWSSGTTGVPKGIQQSIENARYFFGISKLA